MPGRVVKGDNVHQGRVKRGQVWERNCVPGRVVKGDNVHQGRVKGEQEGKGGSRWCPRGYQKEGRVDSPRRKMRCRVLAMCAGCGQCMLV